jgi:hypothetical protein
MGRPILQSGARRSPGPVQPEEPVADFAPAEPMPERFGLQRADISSERLDPSSSRSSPAAPSARIAFRTASLRPGPASLFGPPACAQRPHRLFGAAGPRPALASLFEPPARAQRPHRFSGRPVRTQRSHCLFRGVEPHGRRAGPSDATLPPGARERSTYARTAPSRAPPDARGAEETGGDLLSRALAGQVPSALRGLTALFGMGRGVSPSP